jgi:uncharacterized protein YndB with AHSA1/START domain
MTITQEGTHEQLEDGRHRLVFERRLNHPAERVWAALTDPREIEAWLAQAELEPRLGGRVQLVWLNTDENGNRYEGADATGTVTAFEPPRRLQLDTDRHGVLTWELEPDGDRTDLTFTVVIALPDGQASGNAAGWHVHLDFLGDWLDDDTRIDWPRWPRERWEPLHEHYEASMRPIS